MFRLRYTSVSGFPRTWLTARMPCPATRSPLVTPDVQISRIRRSQIPLPWACTRSCWLLLGRSAQLLSQKREFRRPLPRVRNQSFPKRSSLPLTQARIWQGPFAPRALPRFIATMRPADSRPGPLRRLCFPVPRWTTWSTLSGLSGSFLIVRRTPSPITPESPPGAHACCFPGNGRLHHFRKAGHSQVRVSRPKRVHFITAYVFVPTRLRTPDYSDARSLGYMWNRQFT